VRRELLLLSISLCFAIACTEKEPIAEKVDPEARKKIVLTQAPKPQHPLDIQFGNKIRLLGYDLKKDEVREAEPFTIVWYWHVLEPRRSWTCPPTVPGRRSRPCAGASCGSASPPRCRTRCGLSPGTTA
jgi:hypothetical protein